jgi:hypothetical protein
MDMVNEVRRQFREIPGIMEYKAKPEYQKCVEISTKASIREMVAPGAIALIVPILVGFAFGPEVLGGLLAGVTVSGVLMGMFQNNAGGAWDNAKKSFEKGVDIDGETFYKGSDPHKASVTGDTVGDPFKDTSGPSMNILIKLMSIVSLIIAPHIAVTGGSMDAACCGGNMMNNEYHMGSGCEHMGMGQGMMGMDCEMDTDGNCLIDSATCAKWLAEGKIDSTDCVMAENGKCAISADACMKSMHGKMMECSAKCKAECEAKGIDCSDPKACPMMMKKKDCCKK